VGDLRDARTVVHRRDAERGEPGHVGPAELGPGRPADRRDERGRRRVPQAGPGSLRHVEHGHRPGGEQRPDEVRRLLPVAVRREPVVDRDHALVRHDVPGDPAADGDGVQPLVVAQPVDVRLPGRVAAQHVQDRAGFVDGVASHPGTRGVRPLPGRSDLRPQRALAAALDFRRTRLHQHREVAGQQLRATAAQPQQPVTVGGDLLAVVEHVGHVPGGRGQAGREPQLHRHPGLHVGAAAAVQPRPVEPGGDVARDRHGVEVPGQYHPLRPPERGAGHDRVSVPVHGQVRPGPQRGLDRVRERSFLAADRRDIDELRGQRRPGESGVQIHPASLGAASAARWVGIAFAAARSAVTMTATEGRRTLPVRATA
jgi:hypothetical protein